MGEIYTIKDITAALDVPRERFKEWVYRGYIYASMPADGLGTTNRYSRADVYKIALFIKLLSIGLHRDAAHGRCKKFSPAKESRRVEMEKLICEGRTLAFWTKVADDKHIWEHRFDVDVETFPSGADTLIMVNLAGLRKRVDRALASLA